MGERFRDPFVGTVTFALAAGATERPYVSIKGDCACSRIALCRPSSLYTLLESTSRALPSFTNNDFCVVTRELHECAACVRDDSLEWEYRVSESAFPSSDGVESTIGNPNEKVSQ